MSDRTKRLLFDWLVIVETLTLVVLLVNLVTVHDDRVTSTVGPIHGLLYVAVIIAVLLVPGLSNATRMIAAIPAVGAPWAAWRMRREPVVEA